jgi:hypothetical protein
LTIASLTSDAVLVKHLYVTERLSQTMVDIVNGATASVTESKYLVDNRTALPSIAMPSGAPSDQVWEFIGWSAVRGFTLTVAAGQTFAHNGTTTTTIPNPAAGLPWARLSRQFNEWYLSTGST